MPLVGSRAGCYGPVSVGWLVVLLAAACGGQPGAGMDGGSDRQGGLLADASDDHTGPTRDRLGPDARADAHPGDAMGSDARGGADGDASGSLPCPAGVICVDSFPFHDDGDTSQAPAGRLGGYSCSPADESGPEVIYRVQVPAAGFLSVAVYSGAGVDVDAYILRELDPATCLDRGDLDARADVEAGYYYVIVDTYVDQGVVKAGSYGVDIGFIEPSVGPCAMEVGEMPRVGDNGNHLAMPATGPIVREAHLVTQEEPPPYPMTETDELEAHYRLSQSRTGLVMYRQEVWAPLEGGSFYGAGIGDPGLFPVVHEGWYVNMYWTAEARPDRGTRMILRDPTGGPRAVVVAAGYETGPGDLAHVGGTPEETHFYMGTNHLDPMQLGIAVDQTLPIGPRHCTD